MAASDVVKALLAAVCAPDTFVAAATALVACLLPLAVPQHVRRAPTIAHEGWDFPAAMLNNKYVPSDEQIVPASELMAFLVIVPAAVIAVLSCFDAPKTRSAVAAARLQSLLYAFATTSLVVDCVKRYCGYWRPYFYDECDYDAATGRCGDTPDDAMRSFPSGHSALSMVVMLHSSYCLLGAARLGRPLRVGAVDVGPLAALACLAPAFTALWIAASRVVDNDHWPADVTAGATIGAAFASLWYARYFPSVFDDAAHLPRPGFLPEARANGDAPPYGDDGVAASAMLT